VIPAASQPFHDSNLSLGQTRIPSSITVDISRHTNHLDIVPSSSDDDLRIPPSRRLEPDRQQASLECGSSARLHQRYTLQLANTIIEYSAGDIPDPPALSFVQDLAKLDRQWDDKSSQWDNTCHLHILGHPIALVYWPQIYQYKGTRQWTGIKQRWSDWKVCQSTTHMRWCSHSTSCSLLSLNIGS
jgi:hypothetical protein